MDIAEVKKTIAVIVTSELQGKPFSAFFFGSRISGTHRDASDIDVGIEGAAAVPDDILRSIRARCESMPTLYSVDVVDFSLVSDSFKEVAKQNIESIL